MFSVASFIIILSILILVHEFGHFIVAKRRGVRIDKFSLGFGPAIVKFKKGETEYLICAIPLGGYVKMAGEDASDELKGEKWEYLSQSPGVRAGIVFAGPLLNYILAFLVFSMIFMIGNPTLTTKIGDVTKGYPAQQVGLLPGDKIIAVNGQDVNSWDEMAGIIQKRTEGKINITAIRNGSQFNVSLKPKIDKVKDVLGKTRKIARIGVAASEEVVIIRYNLFKSLYLGGRNLTELTMITYRALGSIVTGRISVRESVTGPIGIFYITTKMSRMGFVYFLYILGAISASLAIFNLLPLPVLDGGHILFLAIEKLRGRPLAVKTQDMIIKTGMSLLILAAIFICYNDLVRFGYLEKIVNYLK